MNLFLARVFLDPQNIATFGGGNRILRVSSATWEIPMTQDPPMSCSGLGFLKPELLDVIL